MKTTMTAEDQSCDLAIVGSGPAGYRAALQTAKLGQKVVIVEKKAPQLGGAWIHTGTIPSKTIRESLDAIQAIKFHAGSAWVDRILHYLNAGRLLSRARQVAAAEEAKCKKYYNRYGIEVINGRGTLKSSNVVEVLHDSGETSQLQAKFILVATGSRPRRPKEIPFDGWRVVDADEILQLENIPQSLLIFGGGVIGCEYATIFASLGVNVKILEPRQDIMQYMDREIAGVLRKSMEAKGIDFVCGHNIKEVRCKGPAVDVVLDDDQIHRADVLFFAAGRCPNTENLGLQELGIEVSKRGAIAVDQNFQTSVPSIYAAGDAIGSPALAATSANQGRHVACHAFGACTKPFPKEFPFGVYTIPELSTAGATEEQLKEQGIEYVVGRASYSEVARGYIRGDDHGIMKLIVCRKSHKILGIHIVGHDACNLIHIGLAFMQKGGHAQDLVDMIFNYPTLAEGYRIAAFNALNKLFPKGEIGEPPQDQEAA